MPDQTQPVQADPFAMVISQQQAWATRNGFDLNADGTGLADRTNAIFGGRLSEDTADEIRKERDRLHSLRSSTCLAVNVCETWRTNPQPISALFGVDGAHDLRFESIQPTKISEPHLDLLIESREIVLGIESKFLELYPQPEDRLNTKNVFSDRYFTTPGIWDGIEACGDLARQIHDHPTTFERLDAAQLLKHAAGLHRNHPGRFRLGLVWYRVDGRYAEDIEAEIGRFSRAVGGAIDFVAITYQDLLASLKQWTPEPQPGYYRYLDDRYNLGDHRSPGFPFLEFEGQIPGNQLDELAATIDTVDTAELVRTYHRSVAVAPRRPLHHRGDRSFFPESHDGGGGASNLKAEDVRAKAIFNWKMPLDVDDRQLRILEYQMPLRSQEKKDKGIGEVDLFGIDIGSHQPWIIEFKVKPNTDTPLKALLQALRYHSIIDANRHALGRELTERFGMDHVRWPAAIAVAADSAYWVRVNRTKEAAGWRKSLQHLIDTIHTELGIDVHLLDMGEVAATLIDGKAHLVEPPVIRSM